MHKLLIFATGNGFANINYHFTHFPPTLDDIEAIQKDAQKKLNLSQTPVIINYLPLSETEENI